MIVNTLPNKEIPCVYVLRAGVMRRVLGEGLCALIVDMERDCSGGSKTDLVERIA